MNFVAADLGASSTRHVSDNGRIGFLPNNMVFLEPTTKVNLEVSTDAVEESLELVIESDVKNCQNFPARVLMGQLATRYSANNIRPSGMTNKHKQRINYISAIASVAVNKLTNGLSDEIYLYLALPPVEAKSAEDTVKESLMGHYKVTFPKFNNVVVEFDIKDVNCYEESYMAMLAYFFDIKGKMREEAKKYSSGNVLSMDIGASTTDLAIVHDMVYQEKSGQTYKIGGNIARDFLIDDLRAEFGYDVPIDLAERAMAEGRIQSGNGFKDIPDMVRSAKRKFAAQIVEQIQGYFRKVNIPIQAIRAIVISGGGSMESSYINEDSERIVTTEPMSLPITNELNNICSGVDVELHGESPRTANITGLFIRAQIHMRKRKSATQATENNIEVAS